MVFSGGGLPLRDRFGPAALVEGDDDRESTCEKGCVRFGDADADVDAAPSRVDDSRGDLDGVADADGAVEADPGDIGRDGLGASPIGSAYVGNFVDPPQDAAAVD